MKIEVIFSLNDDRVAPAFVASGHHLSRCFCNPLSLGHNTTLIQEVTINRLQPYLVYRMTSPKSAYIKNTVNAAHRANGLGLSIVIR